ncbi:MAG: flavoprotein [Candidatus Omnitrophota bacterium]
MKVKKNILLGITASIAAYKACDLIGILRKRGYFVQCVMSCNAKHFITALTVETLTGQKVSEEMFELPANRIPEHISLADQADIIIVAPATADIIGKISAGICDDTLTCTICAAGCPVLIAPAMNDRMWENPIVQENIKKLREKGYYFIDPVIGRLACGREGKGHLAPLEKIAKEAEKILKT